MHTAARGARRALPKGRGGVFSPVLTLPRSSYPAFNILCQMLSFRKPSPAQPTRLWASRANHLFYLPSFIPGSKTGDSQVCFLEPACCVLNCCYVAIIKRQKLFTVWIFAFF